MSDNYESIRSLPFPAQAAALGLDMQRFKTRKDGEFYGPCPVHQPKDNTTSFSYAKDGRFNCFSCNAKGRGAIDLAKLVKSLCFKDAVEFLGSVPPPATKAPPVEAAIASGDGLQGGDKNTEAVYKPLEKRHLAQVRCCLPMAGRACTGRRCAGTLRGLPVQQPGAEVDAQREGDVAG